MFSAQVLLTGSTVCKMITSQLLVSYGSRLLRWVGTLHKYCGRCKQDYWRLWGETAYSTPKHASVQNLLAGIWLVDQIISTPSLRLNYEGRHTSKTLTEITPVNSRNGNSLPPEAAGPGLAAFSWANQNLPRCMSLSFWMTVPRSSVKRRTQGSLCPLQRRAVGSNTGHCARRQRVSDHRLGRKRARKHGHSLQLLLKLSWMCYQRIALCYWDSLLRLLRFCSRQASDLTARAKTLCLELKKPTSTFGYSQPC